jgi:hypothetical protein
MQGGLRFSGFAFPVRIPSNEPVQADGFELLFCPHDRGYLEMAIVNLYSKRQKALRGQTPDVYRYDDLPDRLRVQIVQIWNDAIGDPQMNYPPEAKLFGDVHQFLCREFGMFDLISSEMEPRAQVTQFFLNFISVDECLDVVELVFAMIDTFVRDHADYFRAKVSPDDAIRELNTRFKEHGVGFQYSNRQILRIDSEVMHEGTTVPALQLLQQPFLAGANQEFLAAHEHYRHGRYKECLNECLKAFESTMKAICDKRKWPYSQTDTAKPLIGICEKNNLFPVFMQNHLIGLRTTLESGVPTARNKTSGHGQGVVPITVSEQFAAYVLHLTGANIRFFAESERAMK